MTYEKALCLVDMLSLKNEALSEKISGENVLISCLEDKKLRAKFYKCEIASLSFVLALLCKLENNEAFESFDEGYLSAESCFGEEEALEILAFLREAKYLIIDENLKAYKDFENIKYFLNFLSKEFGLEILNSKEQKQDFKDAKLSALKELDNYDGLVLFRLKTKDDFLQCSKQFLQLAKCKNGQEVEVVGKNLSLRTKLCLNENLQGTIGFLNFESPGFDFVQVRIKEAK